MLNTDELKVFANAYINGTLQYGLSLWSKESIMMIDKIEKLRSKTVEIIFGKDYIKDMNNEEKLDLLNWKSIDNKREVDNNINIHKILYSKKPIKKYLMVTNDRNDEELKYKLIKTIIRSHGSYNDIPYLIRIKTPIKFKKSYQIYREERKKMPKIRKNKINGGYTLLWPGF